MEIYNSIMYHYIASQVLCTIMYTAFFHLNLHIDRQMKAYFIIN